MKLYQRCEAEGIGISVMKPYSAGQLLGDQTSPFGKALTKVQCLQYALDKPGVLTVLPGIRNLEDMQEALSWLDASPEERDYSVLGTFTPKDVTGTCVYCNHCAPCPAGLNIGLINKYYDLAKIGDAMAADHYAKLEKHASDCISCGHCDRRCPFRVAQSDRMKRIAALKRTLPITGCRSISISAGLNTPFYICCMRAFSQRLCVIAAIWILTNRLKDCSRRVWFAMKHIKT